jgi:hypothetical protein
MTLMSKFGVALNGTMILAIGYYLIKTIKLISDEFSKGGYILAAIFIIMILQSISSILQEFEIARLKKELQK